MNRILVVEDEQPIRMALVDMLESEGYEVLEAADGHTAIEIGLVEDPDAILLDLMIPGKDGFEVLRTLREDRLTSIVLILSARGEEMDRIQGFEYGADDYIVKPFSTDELLARLKAALARRGGSTPGVNEVDRVRAVTFGDVTIDFGAYCLVNSGTRHGLSRREMDLLRHFLENDGEALPRTKIVEQVWGPMPSTGKPPTTRTVDQHVMMLRKKIEDRADAPRHLMTVHGVGYRFRARPGTAGDETS